MNDPTPTPAVETSDPRPSGSGVAKIAVFVEVCFAFALVHLAFRSFKRFTALGQAEVGAGFNFSPGRAMILFTLAMLALRRTRFEDYGLTFKGWRPNLNLGLSWSAAFIVTAGWFDRLVGPYFEGEGSSEVAKAAVLTGVELVNTLLLLWFLMRERRILRQIHPAFALLCLLGLLLTLTIAAILRDRSVAYVLLSAAWLFFGAGCGEEVFFRGYVQSRVNEAFGLRFRLLGLEFGWGLIVSALLFGFIHVLNG